MAIDSESFRELTLLVRLGLAVAARYFQIMKVAAAQISYAPKRFNANIAKIRDFASLAKNSGAELIVFPEMVDTGYSMPVIRRHATSWNEAAVPALQKLAKTLSLPIICGISERDGASIYNSQVFIDASGKIIAKYRKTHWVTAAPIEERACFTPGNEFTCFTLAAMRLGVSICYDLRFPETCRTLAVEHKINVFINCSAWPSVRVEHTCVFWRSPVRLKTRAILFWRIEWKR